MVYHLLIEKFGKIEKADIEVSPLTLFVGDNNSGKSYLLSLLWGLYSAGNSSAIFDRMQEWENEKYKNLYKKMEKLVLESEISPDAHTTFYISEFVEVLNILLQKNKDMFVKGIFNYEEVTIQKLQIRIDEDFKFEISSIHENDKRKRYFISCMKQGIGFSEDIQDKEFMVRVMIKNVLTWILNGNDYRVNGTIYLPAARTGFILAKDVINKVGRRTAFDIIEGEQEKITQDVQPFTKPVMRFLDALEEMTIDNKSKYESILNWMENVMTKGNLQYDETGSREIRYVPDGNKNSLPLRTTSAVVTELAPLMLLLRYKSILKRICYEEPEMCLHPALQQEMGKLLIRLVNSGLPIIATTHSDIIIQHINNMCRIYEAGNPEKLLHKLNLSKEDGIDIKKVAVYQFKNQGQYSSVERVVPQNGEFLVETFSNALMDILDLTSEVQEFEQEQEG